MLVVLLGGCADDLGSVARRQGISAMALIRLSEGFAVAARRAGERVEVVAFGADQGGGWSAEVIAGGADGEMTTHLVTMGGETGQEWNSFLFGSAPNGASRVVMDTFGATGGQVVGGAWVLAIRSRDVAPHQLTWRVLDPIGGVITSGAGLAP
ncbi:MAG: hypothetical protein ACR2GO_01640 [Candidatus Limnocylindria bacterium]